jgi:hypothetical protein
MIRETIDLNIFDGLDSINSVGKDDDFSEEDEPQKESNINSNINVNTDINANSNLNENINTDINTNSNINENSNINININNDNQSQKEKNENRIENEKIEDKKDFGKPKEIIKEKEENKINNNNNIMINNNYDDQDLNEDDDEDEKIVVKKLKKMKKKIIYSVKDDTKFMLIPKERMPSNKYFYLILFAVLTSASIISDIFSMIISNYKSQISFNIVVIIFRLIFISSNIITIKFEFEALIIAQLVISNCLFFYGVLYIMFLYLNHDIHFSNGFLWFCYVLYFISIGCNFITIINLYIKFYNVYASMTEDDIKYLKIFNKRNDSREIQLVEKND